MSSFATLTKLLLHNLYVPQIGRNAKHAQRFTTLSSFEPPIPPQSKGNAMYPDILLTNDSIEPASARNADKSSVFVVTGASRGIGRQIVLDTLKRKNGHIIACCRNPEEIEETFPSDRVSCLRLDLENNLDIQSASDYISNNFGRVDMLWNVAGILGNGSIGQPERSLSHVNTDWMTKTFQINTIGPVLFSRSLAPLMKTNVRGKTNENPRPKSVIANLSARVGSISDNQLGGWYSYRMSKAALNQATKTMALELKRQGIWTISLHPGTTDTDLSKPFQKNVKAERLFPVEFTSKRLIDVVDCMEEIHSGGFYDWSGKALPF